MPNPFLLPTTYPTVAAAGGGGSNWWDSFGKKSLMTGVPAALSLLSNRGGSSLDTDISKARGASESLAKTGARLTSEGENALMPVLHYFAALASGDPGAIDALTAEDRGRVIDQYDAASRAATTFSPRGGGLTSTIGDINRQKAKDLAALPMKARGEGASALGQLAQSLTQAGVSASENASYQMAQLLYPLLNRQQQNDQNTAATFESLGSLLAMAFL